MMDFLRLNHILETRAAVRLYFFEDDRANRIVGVVQGDGTGGTDETARCKQSIAVVPAVSIALRIVR